MKPMHIDEVLRQKDTAVPWRFIFFERGERYTDSYECGLTVEGLALFKAAEAIYGYNLRNKRKSRFFANGEFPKLVLTVAYDGSQASWDLEGIMQACERVKGRCDYQPDEDQISDGQHRHG
jgi:hypothetical protein